jgi:hypothetical protein
MTKLTTPRAATRGNARRARSAWLELADHVLVERLPAAAIGLDLVLALATGRAPLRALLLVAALAI